MKPRTERILRDLAPKAAVQYGLVTRAQIRDTGATDEWFRWHVRSGVLRAVEPSVFLLPGHESTWTTEAMAACLRRGPHARVGLGSAARLWDLSVGQIAASDRIQVLVPAAARGSSTSRIHVHRTQHLISSDGATLDRLPITTVARTIVDLARSLDAGEVESLVDDALVRKLTTTSLLSSTVRRNCHQGTHGAVALRSALDLWAPGEMESHAELRVLRWLLKLGVPRPVCQLRIRCSDGRVFRVDFAWPAWRVVLEVDGFAHHHGPRKLSADHERRSALIAEGWRVLTCTQAEIDRGGRNLSAALSTLGVWQPDRALTPQTGESRKSRSETHEPW